MFLVPCKPDTPSLYPEVMTRLNFLTPTAAVWSDADFRTTHVLPESTTQATLVSRARQDGLTDLIELRFSAAQGTPNSPLPTATFADILDAATLRQLFRGHLLSLQGERIRRRLPFGLLPTLESTTFRYMEFRHWGESSPASLIAEFDQVPVMTVHNRLRSAREKGWLTAPGTGRRSSAVEDSLAEALSWKTFHLWIRGNSVANAGSEMREPRVRERKRPRNTK